MAHPLPLPRVLWRHPHCKILHHCHYHHHHPSFLHMVMVEEAVAEKVRATPVAIVLVAVQVPPLWKSQQPRMAAPAATDC